VAASTRQANAETEPMARAETKDRGGLDLVKKLVTEKGGGAR